jgi:hypothetical protein
MGATQSACKVEGVEAPTAATVGRLGNSVSSAISYSVDRIQGELARQTRSYKEIANLTYEEFLENVSQLNGISQHFLDDNGKVLVFAVKKGTDSSSFWKGTVKVACCKVDAETKSADSLRLLNLKEFLSVHKSIQAQSSILLSEQGVLGKQDPENPANPSEEGSVPATSSAEFKLRHKPFSHSMILDEALHEGISLEECCVCLERKPDTILPCAHSYCTRCIQQWNVNHKTCPVCRESLDSTADGWVVSDCPDMLDIATEIQKSLMEIAQE